MLKRWMKKLSTYVLIGTLLTPSVTAMANEQISPWAVMPLHKSQSLELLPSNFLEVLHDPITPDQLTLLFNGLYKNLEALGLTPLENAIPIEFTNMDKFSVATYIFDTLHQYDLSEYPRFTNNGAEAIDYMMENNILRGPFYEHRSCTTQEALVLASRFIQHLYEVFDVGSEGFLWEVSDENNTVYLLGSIHSNDPDLFPFSSELDSIINEMDAISFELDFRNQEGLNYFTQSQFYQDGTQLSDVLEPKLYEEVIKATAPLGLSEEIVQTIKPWALSNALTALSINDSGPTEETSDAYNLPAPVLDMYIQDTAFLSGKDVLEIEGYVFQADLFNDMSLDMQIHLLEDAVSSLNSDSSSDKVSSEIALVDEWIQSWVTGDLESFEASYPKDVTTGNTYTDDFNTLLFGNRDSHMTKAIIDYLEDPSDKNYLVVVGGGHMIGAEGIVSRLTEAGYTVHYLSN